ncbi:MAG: cytochrome b6-f complex subunit PetN [Gloeobacterales cyanobacterium]
MSIITLGWTALILFFVGSIALTVWGRGGL